MWRFWTTRMNHSRSRTRKTRFFFNVQPMTVRFDPNHQTTINSGTSNLHKSERTYSSGTNTEVPSSFNNLQTTREHFEFFQPIQATAQQTRLCSSCSCHTHASGTSKIYAEIDRKIVSKGAAERNEFCLTCGKAPSSSKCVIEECVRPMVFRRQTNEEMVCLWRLNQQQWLTWSRNTNLFRTVVKLWS